MWQAFSCLTYWKLIVSKLGNKFLLLLTILIEQGSFHKISCHNPGNEQIEALILAYEQFDSPKNFTLEY